MEEEWGRAAARKEEWDLVSAEAACVPHADTGKPTEGGSPATV